MNRKRVILAALLGTLVACLFYAYVATPRLEQAPPRATAQKARPVVKASGEKLDKRPAQRISFDFMTVEPQEFSGAQRDIFRFVQRRPVRAELPVAPPPVAPPPVVEPVMPMAVVQQALSQFTFLGFLDKAGEKIVFLSSGGKLFLVTRGESFGANQEFKVTEIKDNLLKVQHAGRADIVEIPLIEKQKLNVSVSAPARRAPLGGGAAQPSMQNLTPKRRMLRPAVPQESEQPVPEINEETSPAEGQATEPPAAGGVLEGEVNGTNQ